jgi:hypothetical protein
VEIPPSGQQSTSPDEYNVVKVCEVICSNRCLTVQEVPDEAGISKKSCGRILTENLCMKRIAAKSVPRLQTDKQKQSA